jgi:hypothetical protein
MIRNYKTYFIKSRKLKNTATKIVLNTTLVLIF